MWILITRFLDNQRLHHFLDFIRILRNEISTCACFHSCTYCKGVRIAVCRTDCFPYIQSNSCDKGSSKPIFETMYVFLTIFQAVTKIELHPLIRTQNKYIFSWMENGVPLETLVSLCHRCGYAKRIHGKKRGIIPINGRIQIAQEVF